MNNRVSTEFKNNNNFSKHVEPVYFESLTSAITHEQGLTNQFALMPKYGR